MALSAWERVRISRGQERPTSLFYIENLFDHFFELHGDRSFRDDPAIVGGIAFFEGRPVTVIGEQKGRNTKENLSRNFGMPNPEGYRKALRLMEQANKFHRPIICFVDTAGAYCGLEAEERGQGGAIAENLMAMAGFEVPILSILIGEGGSGGALALAVANEVWMLENSTYSVLSPEGFASILWKNSKRASEAAEVMKMTARELRQMGVVDKIVKEKELLTEETSDEVLSKLKFGISRFLKEYSSRTAEELTVQRYERFRKF